MEKITDILESGFDAEVDVEEMESHDNLSWVLVNPSFLVWTS